MSTYTKMSRGWGFVWGDFFLHSSINVVRKTIFFLHASNRRVDKSTQNVQSDNLSGYSIYSSFR